MKAPVLLTLPLVLLVACGTPQEQCIARGTRDLRTVEKLIAETEGNLKRGFAYEEKIVRFPVFRPCVLPSPPVAEGTPPPPPQVTTCRDTEEQVIRQPVAIDLEEEARKLRQLQEKRRVLLREAEAVAAACRAEYPE
jgi:hypothetical protein